MYDEAILQFFRRILEHQHLAALDVDLEIVHGLDVGDIVEPLGIEIDYGPHLRPLSMKVNQVEKLEIGRQQRIHPRHVADAVLVAASVANGDRKISLAPSFDRLQLVKGLGVGLESNQQCQIVVDQILVGPSDP